MCQDEEAQELRRGQRSKLLAKFPKLASNKLWYLAEGVVEFLEANPLDPQEPDWQDRWRFLLVNFTIPDRHQISREVLFMSHFFFE